MKLKDMYFKHFEDCYNYIEDNNLIACPFRVGSFWFIKPLFCKPLPDSEYPPAGEQISFFE